MRSLYTTPMLVARACALMLLLTPSILSAQKPGTRSGAKPATAAEAADPKLKGIWEPVSYPADVYLNDVYFATPDIGWVAAGAHRKPGMIIHTKDGGANWTVQLGDPESSDPAFHDLRFIDAHHGWVLQDASLSEHKLLHTSNGQDWSQVGSIKRHWGIPDYEFVSPREGLHIDGNNNVSRIMRTSDGGRTWTEVYQCAATIQVEGLTKDVKCALKTLHFVTPRVGYALGGANGAKRTLFVAKTEDGGNSWKLSIIPDVGGDREVSFDQAAFFTDETTGVVGLSDKRIYRTTDGGRSWKGIVGTPGPEIRFADPVVGWSFSSYRTLSYSTDGGNRWTTREFAFPAKVTAFSLPRRDRAFVVGEHGMIYRYRVIGPAEAAAPKAIPAPAMPLFDSPLDEQVSELDQVVEAIEAAVAATPETTTGADAAPENYPEAAAAPDEWEEGAEYPETSEEYESGELAGDDMAESSSAFTATCCSKSLEQFQLILSAVSTTVPQFLASHKNTNLLVAGLRMLTDLPGRVNDLDGALRAFRKAPDKTAAASALEQVSAAIAALSQSTAVAFQKQAPPAGEGTEDPEATAVEAGVGEHPEDGAAEEAEMAPVEDVKAATPDAVEETPEDEADGTSPEDSESEPAEESSAETPSDDWLAAEAARAAEQEAKTEAKKAIKKKLRF